ncbi:hypothetical protein O7634_25210 [Micromonospora sp. WMMD1120]|uniref:hypothetical protein n=1 Tax=Micromonospora sp. WMMD1120 TaxID=3016106 RepID=UPI002415BAC7|nr:hypothetical protein [Micromonospora sp. WMMD1120]MDG4810065.1 hypothetical protein [Micromonospora sp. WMMD1120]
MSKRALTRVAISALAVVGVLTASATSASAATVTLTNPRIAVHFDYAAGQQPENILVRPDGTADLVLARSYQVVNVDRQGRVRVLGTLPAPSDGGANTPVLGFALATGIARSDDGTLYVGYAAGSSELTGIWRLRPGGAPRRIAALPANSLPNGMALNRDTGDLLVADSVLGRIWRVPTGRGEPSVWVSDRALERVGEFQIGANGLKIHNGAVWVSNSDQGTLHRIPVDRRGNAGPFELRASGIVNVDDFDFVGRSNVVVAALNVSNQVVVIQPDGTYTVALTAEDGLNIATAIGIRGTTAYVTSGSFLLTSGQDPNLLLADITMG